MKDEKRYPVEPLCRLCGIDPEDDHVAAKLARAVGLLTNTVDITLRRNSRTLSAEQADSWATGAGLGPEVVWPEAWFDDRPLGAPCRCAHGPFRDEYAEPGDEPVCDRCGRPVGDRAVSPASWRDRQWEATIRREGISQRKFAEREGVHPSTVLRAMARVRPPKPFTNSTEQILALRAQGFSTSEIVARSGKSRSAVYNVIGATRKTPTPIGETERAAILRRHAEGESAADLAKAFGRRESTIHAIVPNGKRIPLTSEEQARIERLFAEGWHRKAIAVELGRDWGVVNRALKRAAEKSQIAA